MQLVVGGYALRLNRLFGTAKVGWPLFCAALPALLHLVQIEQRNRPQIRSRVFNVMIQMLQT
jgi:hypothetical protein